ncbi:MAG: hypothetical protein GF398_02920 [Chitinivibrionales bacterium]|nr:hypothetical protein [Chitinivibrionales bacterium]
MFRSIPFLFIVVFSAIPLLAAPSWVQVNDGPKPAGKDGDAGIRRDAIIRSEYLDIGQSTARTPGGDRIEYVHPSCFDETDKGTIVMGFNGGISEAEGDNRAFFVRKPAGGQWQEPGFIEPDIQIDFGVIYQPRNEPNAPLLAYYWAGGPPSNANGAVRVSTDDGQTWSPRTLAPQSSYWQDNRGTMQCGMNHPLEWPDGTLWFASSDEAQGLRDCHAYITKVPPDNYGNSGGGAWQVADIQGNSNDGNTHGDWLILSPDYQELMYYTRTNFNAGTYFTNSSDAGQSWKSSWTKLSQDLTNGISCVSLSPHDANHTLNGYHIVCGSKHGTRRGRLDVYLSTDPLSNSWTRVLELNYIPWNGPKYEENADPTIFQSRDGSKIHLLFTGRDGDELKYYVIDAYKLCNETATRAGDGRMSSAYLGEDLQAVLSSDSHLSITYRLPGVSKVNLMLYSAHGKLLRTVPGQRRTAGKVTIDLATAGLARGIYLAGLEIDAKLAHKRRIVVR